MAVTGNNMAKKIEGWAGFDNDGSAIIGKKLNKYLDKRCTTVIHEGEVERVFTESEVRAMLMDAFRGYDRTGAGIAWERMKAVASEHGIVIGHVNGQGLWPCEV